MEAAGIFVPAEACGTSSALGACAACSRSRSSDLQLRRVRGCVQQAPGPSVTPDESASATAGSTQLRPRFEFAPFARRPSGRDRGSFSTHTRANRQDETPQTISIRSPPRTCSFAFCSISTLVAPSNDCVPSVCTVARARSPANVESFSDDAVAAADRRVPQGFFCMLTVCLERHAGEFLCCVFTVFCTDIGQRESKEGKNMSSAALFCGRGVSGHYSRHLRFLR